MRKPFRALLAGIVSYVIAIILINIAKALCEPYIPEGYSDIFIVTAGLCMLSLVLLGTMWGWNTAK